VKLGSLTACLPGRSPEEITTWAAAEGHVGQVDRRRVVDTLYEGGPDGVLVA